MLTDIKLNFNYKFFSKENDWLLDQSFLQKKSLSIERLFSV